MVKVLMTIQIVSLIYSLLLAIVYFSKKKIKSFETTFYKFMIIGTIIGFAIEIANNSCFYIYNKNEDLAVFIAKIYLSHYLLFNTLIFFYIYIKHFYRNNKDKKYNKRFVIISTIETFIMITLIWIFKIIANLGIDYYYGTGKYIFVIGVNVLITLNYCIFVLIKDYKKMTSKEKILHFSIILLYLISSTLRVVEQAFTINNTIFSFVTAIMFFTIENPDIKMIEDLKRANAAKDKFLSSMSHEMRTPLNGIIGLSSISEGEDMKDINKEANLLLDIVNNVIEINSLNKEQIYNYKETFNIETIISPIVENTREILSNTKTELLYSINNVPNQITTNPDAIKSIISKVISNSIKYTNQGYIELKINYNEDKLLITIKDTGTGIKKETLNTIFDTFSREEDNMDGTISGLGLGLSIVKQTIDALKGKIEINSEENQGTEVNIEIPISR